MARSLVMNGKARHAWELYLRMETTDESFQLLQLVANDCYKTGQVNIITRNATPIARVSTAVVATGAVCALLLSFCMSSAS